MNCLFRYHDHWKLDLHHAAYLAALIVFLETERLISPDELESWLGSRFVKRSYEVFDEMEESL
jgi:hypothetical protein